MEDLFVCMVVGGVGGVKMHESKIIIMH